MRYHQLLESKKFPIPATPENILKAKEFVFRKWKERATERGLPTPQDLSSSCKFGSLFAQKIFGGKLQGNYDHQHVVLPDGQIIDFSHDAEDVKSLRNPYKHDKKFWNNPDHRESMASCLPRVNQWVEEFSSEISELEEAKDWHKIKNPALQWLGRFTYENYPKNPPSYVIQELLSDYPCETGTYYRGLNFYSKEKYDEFVSQFNNGEAVSEFDSVTSWTKHEKDAEQFAITQPTYQPNLAVMRAHDVAQKNKERVTGYRGIIISTHVNAGQAIDVDKAGVGHESEVVLPAGKYNVKVYKVVTSYKDALADTDTDVDKVILSTTRDDVHKDDTFFKYVMHHHKDQLSDKARKHIFDLYSPSSDKPLFSFVDYGESKDYESGQMVRSVSMHSPAFALFWLYETGIFTDPVLINKIKQMARKVLQQALPVIEKYLPSMSSFGTKGWRLAAKIAGQEDKLQAIIQKTIGKEVTRLENQVAEINKIKDPMEKKIAIRQHGIAMAAIIKKISG